MEQILNEAGNMRTTYENGNEYFLKIQAAGNL
jgi:hypothetical protein